MSAFERYGLDKKAGPDPLGDNLPPVERAPCYGPFYPPDEAADDCCYGICAGCGAQDAELWRVGSRWLCWRCEGRP